MYKLLCLLIISSLLFILCLSCGGNSNSPNPTGYTPDSNSYITIPAPDGVVVDTTSILIGAYNFYETTFDTTLTVNLDSIDTIKTLVDTTEYVDSVSGRFLIKWNSVTYSKRYNVFVSDSISGELSIYSTIDTFYTVRSLIPDHTYNVSISGYAYDTTTIDTIITETDTTIAVTDSLTHKGIRSATVVVRLKFPDLPVSLSASYLGGTIKLSWSKASSDKGIRGYKAYLFDYTGSVVDSIEVDSNTLSTDFSVDADKVYKASVIIKTMLGYGVTDSIYYYDKSNLTDSKIKLPYIYISTYSPPVAPIDSLVDSIQGVTGGAFIMGNIWTDSLGGDSSTVGLPIKEVEVKSFLMSKTEISNSDFAKYLSSIKLTPDTLKSINMYDTSKTDSTLIDTTTTYLINSDTVLTKSKYLFYNALDSTVVVINTLMQNNAVTGVYYKGAALYCNYLSNANGDSAVYLKSLIFKDSLVIDISRNGYRLPTEAEFEFVQSAAFLGTKNRFPWGYTDNSDLYVNTGTDADSVNFGKSYYGFYNMTGNALEICSDSNGKIVLRGGGYSSLKYEYSSNIRVVNFNGDHSTHGFRVAKSLE